MIYLIIGIVVLGIFAAVLGLLSKNKDEEPDVVKPTTSSCAGCNGYDPTCEQECMMVAATKDIEYFDDEELDRYKGRQSDQYTDKEAEEFSEVLYSMKPEEVKDWNRSLVLRGINVPDQIKDDLVMMIQG